MAVIKRAREALSDHEAVMRAMWSQRRRRDPATESSTQLGEAFELQVPLRERPAPRCARCRACAHLAGRCTATDSLTAAECVAYLKDFVEHFGEGSPEVASVKSILMGIVTMSPVFP